MNDFHDDVPLPDAPPDHDDGPTPYSLEAEKCVLGAILIDDRLYGRISDVLTPQDFFRAAHGHIYAAIAKLKARNVTPDFVTLKDDLASRGELDECGGPAYIAALTDGVPRASNIDQYARIVQEKSHARRLIAATKDARARAGKGDDTLGVVQDLERELADITAARAWQGAFYPIQKVQEEAWEEVDRRMVRAESKAAVGLPTGFNAVDDMTSGLQPTDLIIIAGRPSMGKTSFAMNIVENACAANPETVVGVFSLEMSKVQLYNRMLSSTARVEASRIRSGRLTEMDLRSISEGMQKLWNTRIYIDDTGTQTPHDILGRARRLKMDQGLHLLVIDYIQLMAGVGRFDSRQQEVSSISRALKALAKELGVPVVALAQLSRALEARKDKEPMLSDLRESGALEQDADVVMFIHREEKYARTDENAGKAKVIIGKQRNGPTGSCELAFIEEFTRFENTTLGFT